jgi:hypothetical protein
MEGSHHRKIHSSGKVYLGYVSGSDKILGLHIDIHFPDTVRESYVEKGVLEHKYKFASEELGCKFVSRHVYVCRIRGLCVHEEVSETIRLIKTVINDNVDKNGGWVLVRPEDIDVYNRILIDVYNIKTRQNIYDILMATKTSAGKPVVRKYERPTKPKMICTRKDMLRMAKPVKY